MGMVDNTLFTKKKSSNLITVQIYVDDIIFGSTCQDMCDEFAKIMHDEFEMSMMGKLNFFLGLQIKQMEDSIFLFNLTACGEMLKKFGLEDSKPMKTPTSSDTKLTKDEKYGPYQTNPPFIEDIISSVRIDREGQVRRIRHEEEIDVHDYQILTREIIPTLKPLEEIIEKTAKPEGIVAREEAVIPLLRLPPSINHTHLISTMMMTMGMTKEPSVQALLPPFVMSIP
ncbi:retrovirus-related pol polyprotein from transposon TNT 1-94 [Tanacetum coccineum]